MLWIKNLKINNKLMIMVLVPMIGLLYFSITAVITKLNDRTELGQLEKKTILEVKALDMIHELQNELGITTNYYVAPSENKRKTMLEQRKSANESIDDFKQYLRTTSKLNMDEETIDRLNIALEMQGRLATEREITNKQTTNPATIIAFYNDLVGAYIHWMDQMKLKSMDLEIATSLNALQSFSKSKVLLSQERVHITQAFDIDSLALLDKERQLYYNSFALNASLEWLTVYKSIIKGQVIDEANRMRKIILDGDDNTYSNVDL